MGRGRGALALGAESPASGGDSAASASLVHSREVFRSTIRQERLLYHPFHVSPRGRQ